MEVVNLLELPTSYIIGGAAVIIAVLLFIVWVRRSPGTLNTTYPLSRGSRGGPMFGNTKKPQTATPSTLNGKPETVIGTNTSIVGSLKSDGNIRIDGSVEGDIEILGNLIIGETGRVIATLKAQNVHVSGAVKGDITTAALHIEPGGLFRGQSAMSTNIDEPLLLEAPRASRAE